MGVPGQRRGDIEEKLRKQILKKAINCPGALIVKCKQKLPWGNCNLNTEGGGKRDYPEPSRAGGMGN